MIRVGDRTEHYCGQVSLPELKVETVRERAYREAEENASREALEDAARKRGNALKEEVDALRAEANKPA
jgi:hypothetical protein